MEAVVREAVEAVDAMREELVELCRALVRINTVNPYAGGVVTGCEGDGQAFLAPVLRAMGGMTRLFEPPPDVFERLGVIAPKGRSWSGRPNLVTEFDLGPGPRIVLNSHMDTVGVDDMVFDPFAAELKDGRILGRGASDDKGGLAAGIIAIKAALRVAGSLSGTIVHQSVVDEECSGSGAGTLACVLAGCTGDEAVVIDGGGLEIMRGCRGCLTADIGVAGRAGHAAQGGVVNAIDKAILVKQAIDAFKAEREGRDPDNRLNVGVFRAGVHPAVVPGSALLSLNLVYGVDEAEANAAAGGARDGAAVRRAFEERIRAASEADGWLREHPCTLTWVKDLVPFDTPADAAPVRELARAFAAVTGAAPVVGTMAAWADAANLSRYGGVPSVLFGPGTEGAAHAADETVSVDDLVRCAKVVAAYLCRRLMK